LYLKHNPEILQALKTNKPEYEKLAPFIDETGDVAPFQEVRTTAPVEVEQAVWLLTTNQTRKPAIPEIDTFQTKYGRISKSYWHRSHQMAILGEWQFTSLAEDEHGRPVKFEFIGEHYWRQEFTVTEELRVTLPVDEKKITFETSDRVKHAAYTGPWRFIDVARSIAQVLVDAREDLGVALRYRLIHDLARP
jgi:hypothetical protein